MELRIQRWERDLHDPKPGDTVAALRSMQMERQMLYEERKEAVCWNDAVCKLY